MLAEGEAGSLDRHPIDAAPFRQRKRHRVFESTLYPVVGPAITRLSSVAARSNFKPGLPVDEAQLERHPWIVVASELRASQLPVPSLAAAGGDSATGHMTQIRNISHLARNFPCPSEQRMRGGNLKSSASGLAIALKILH